jgi:guanine deaminase
MIALDNHELLNTFIKRAIELSTARVASGGIPFSALVVDANAHIIGEGVNEVIQQRDPTAHAEVAAIRQACRHQDVTQLAGMTLIASGEPCAMCYTVALWAGIDQIIYLTGRDDAAAAGFDYRASYRLFAVDPRQWPLPVSQHYADEAMLPFEAWRRRRSSDGPDNAPLQPDEVDLPSQ